MTGHPTLTELVERSGDAPVAAHLATCATCRARARLVTALDESAVLEQVAALSAGRQRAADSLYGALTHGGELDRDEVELATGQRVDRWVVEERLGAGAMGTVYRVRHATLGSTHALKVVSGGSRALHQRLLREGRAQGQLRHPHVVAVTDVVDVAGAPGLVMELVEGPTLAAYLRARDRLSPGEVDELAEGILKGVGAAHRAGLVHRDLKPANVLLAQADGVLIPKVADFGLARTSDTDATDSRSGVPLGTPSYMAPEQIRDASSADARSDVFSLGALLYELVTGQRAFVGAAVVDVFDRIRAGARAPVRAHAPLAPARWVDTIDRALQLDPAARFADADALLAGWRGEPVLVARAAPRTWWVVGAGAAVCALLAVSSGLYPPTPAEAPERVDPTLDRRLTARTSELQLFAVAVSPDGAEIAYTDAQGVKRQQVSGGEPRVVIGEGPFHDVDWFPDGRHLLVHGTWGGVDGVWSIAPDGSAPELLLEGMLASTRLSPDGTRIAVVEGRALSVVDVATRARQRLRPLGGADGTAALAWSPSGRVLAAVHLAGSEAAWLELTSADGRWTRRILQDVRLTSLSLSSLSWLPPDRLVFALTDSGTTRWMALDGAEAAEDTAHAFEVRRFEGFDVTHTDWTPDGRHVIYTRITSWTVPYALPLDGGSARSLSREEWNQSPLAWPGDGGLWVQSDRGRGEVVRLGPDGTASQVLGPARVVRHLDPLGAGWVYLDAGGDELEVVRHEGGVRTVVRTLTDEEPEAWKRYLLRCRQARCLLSATRQGVTRFQWLDPQSGALTAAPVATPTDQPVVAWDLSPDGARLAVATPVSTLVVHELATGARETWPLAIDTPTEVAWNTAGDAVFVSGLTNHTDSYRLDEVRASGTRGLWSSMSSYLYRPTPSPDGAQLAFATAVFDDDLWLTGGLLP